MISKLTAIVYYKCKICKHASVQYFSYCPMCGGDWEKRVFDTEET
jgi:hypothetical protein